MNFDIDHGPSFAWLKVNLQPGDTIDAEAGAMVTRDLDVGMQTRLNAGRGAGVWRKFVALIVALARKFLGGETMFINSFSAPQGGSVSFAPSLSGEIIHRRLEADTAPLVVAAGAYLASSPQIDAALMWGGLRALFGGEGLFFLRCTGQGDLFLNSYGGIVEVQCDGKYIVDSGHIVAFDGSLDMHLRGAGKGLKGLLFSGEGLVCEFSGRGSIFIQSRNIGALVAWLSPNLPA
jgi:uncharacterized protein (TIGR00266 family)